MGQTFPTVGEEKQSLDGALERILSQDVVSDIDLPGFNRATMDGFAVQARSTFGASESMPALFQVVGTVHMGEAPTMAVRAGEAVRIATGGMLPQGADAVVMVEHTQNLDGDTVEIFKSVAPLQHVMEAKEDFGQGERVLPKGRLIRPQEIGVLAALGRAHVSVYRQPVLAIVSSGDEIVPIEQTPSLSELRDVNAHSLSGLVRQAGGLPVCLGIAKDSLDDLNCLCRKGVAQADMVLISGGSSVGTRDFTLDVLEQLPDSEILIHGVSVSPGKPTILARTGNTAVWGLPGQVTSAMVVFHTMVRPALEWIAGLRGGRRETDHCVSAILSRNVASVQGREDFVRIRLVSREGHLSAEPILGKSGLIHTMVKADGLIRLDRDSEGLDQGTPVDVMLF